jgi:predicted RNA-binding Zn ribbon-like protein
MNFGGYALFLTVTAQGKMSRKMEYVTLDSGGYSGTYEATAGRLCLDFANTLANRTSDDPHEWLDSYTNLVAWAQLAGALSPEAARPLVDKAAAHPEMAAQALNQAIEFRETIYRVFSAVNFGHSPAQSDLDDLNSALSEALPHLRVVLDEAAFAWDWNDEATALERMLWPVARSAADLLTSEELGRVGECQGDGCGWLFLDLSRNHSRRWCDMGDCGNRAKARRHYHRKKLSTTNGQ